MHYTILILVSATSKWMSLPRNERDRFTENELMPILKKFSSDCTVRLFDSDFLHPYISDFIIVETDNLPEYGKLIGYLRESKTFAAPYFEVKELVVGVENNFRGSMDVSDITGNQ